MPQIRHKESGAEKSLSWKDFSTNYFMEDWVILEEGQPVLILKRKSPLAPFKRIKGYYDIDDAKKIQEQNKPNTIIQPLSENEIKHLTTRNLRKAYFMETSFKDWWSTFTNAERMRFIAVTGILIALVVYLIASF